MTDNFGNFHQSGKKSRKKIAISIIIVFVIASIASGLGLWLFPNQKFGSKSSTNPSPSQSSSGILQIVAAENFWGSLVSQLVEPKLTY